MSRIPVRKFSSRVGLIALSLHLTSPLPARAAGAEFAAASRLADAGEPVGYYGLGAAYQSGDEVEKDLFEAARQYQLAAESDHLEAQFALGLLLTGALPRSPRSPRKSFHWFETAARRGHTQAAYFLAVSYETGAGTERSAERAFEWYRRAAISGNRDSMIALARMYATGAGIRTNLANAHAWNQVAAAHGFEAADRYAAALEAQMNTEDLARAGRLMRGLMRKIAGSAES